MNERVTKHDVDEEHSTVSSTEERLSGSGQSRRQWMVASAAVAAGSLVACGDSGSNTGGQGAGCAPDEVAPSALPAFERDRCTDQIESSPPPPDDNRFAAWNEELRAKAGGRESAFVDLDAVDHNMKLVGSQLGSRIALRLVTKSLPSIRLLEYMMVTACTNRVMAFSEGMIRDLLCRFGSDVDILLGRPATVEAAARTFATLDTRYSGNSNPASTVRWLVDTPVRLAEYRDLANERGSTINIAVEIDVGLRRGGALNDEELLAMLSILDESSRLQFTGFMGYEGHVPFAPTGANPDREFAEVHRRYADFVRVGSEAFPELFAGPLVHNSGGSRTYHRYTNDLQTPVNEIAMGSAFFFPFNFADLPAQELRRATFLASPVLKRNDPAEIPFAPGFLPRLAEDDPNLEVSFHVVAGGFAGEQVFPEGLVENTIVSTGSEGVSNLLSNQAEWLGSRQVALEVGDFVFYHPWEGDGVRWLSRLDVFRSGELVDQWSTFQPGIRLT
jgi:D-serine deaminase-like pyridoxal phosphate-dependent protein